MRDADTVHWADAAAARTMAAHPELSRIVVASGITPSGVVHIGNFREVITVDLVARALRDRGADVRFIYSWDDFDVFRKVPSDMPKQAMLAENLRRSIADVPDPYGEHDSYASHNIAAFEGSLEPLGIRPEFIRQSKRYRAGAYAEGVRKALEHRKTIAGILDKWREKPLADDWLPLAGFCTACGRDELDFTWDGEWGVKVHCRDCGHDANVDLREGGNLKLPWRIDWPMRWSVEGVTFEPGGKDHSSAGGSYDTAKEIVRDVYGTHAPEYVAYDFVRVKGQGGKISSSKGGALTVADVLEVYEPEVLRWIFASYKPNTEFQISFDLDAIKIYEDYDRTRRLAHEAEDGTAEDGKRRHARRVLELSRVEHEKIEPGTTPARLVGFRSLSVLMQVFEGDVERARQHLVKHGEVATAEEHDRLTSRARCVWNWIRDYAPDEFKYQVRREPKVRTLSDDERLALGRLVSGLEAAGDDDENRVIDVIKGMTEGTSLKGPQLFPVIYDLLLDRDKGPKLSTLIVVLGVDRVLPLLRASL
jgi:lysyl-tRNA synthetase class 1